jgi:hypothetical protein
MTARNRGDAAMPNQAARPVPPVLVAKIAELDGQISVATAECEELRAQMKRIREKIHPACVEREALGFAISQYESHPAELAAQGEIVRAQALQISSGDARRKILEEIAVEPHTVVEIAERVGCSRQYVGQCLGILMKQKLAYKRNGAIPFLWHATQASAQ